MIEHFLIKKNSKCNSQIKIRLTLIALQAVKHSFAREKINDRPKYIA